MTNIATDRPGLAWWVSLGALVILGISTQVWLTKPEERGADVTAAGAGSVAVGGSTHGQVKTRVRGSATQNPPDSTAGGIRATGPGSIAIGGDAMGDVSSDFDAPR
ncbi:hypothetical protein [Streptomyces sp. NPDC093514]|uniref:hypothetical protein n=1 Tax=Streptomyces sp. NPDC093514 TaxID=3366039 RepID=UPI003811612C